MERQTPRWMLVGQLGSIFLLALVVRLWGLDFGLPYGQIPDETTDVTMSFQLARGQLPPYPFHRVAWSLIQMPVHALHFAILKVENPQYSFEDFEAHYYTDRSIFLLTARLAMAVIGSLCVLPLYMIGRDLSHHRGGLLAALITAVHPLHAYLSHTGLPDVLGTLAAAICLLAALRIAKTGQIHWYLIGGIATALSLLTRLQIAPIGLALVVAHIVYSLSQPSKRVHILASRWLWLVLGGVIGLAVFNPIIWLNPAAAWADFQFILSERFVGTWQNDPHAQTSLTNSFYNIQQNSGLPLIMVRPVVLVFVCIGGVFGVLRRDVRILIVAALMVFALPILAAPGPRITYWLALVVPCAALASYGLVHLAQSQIGRFVAILSGVVIVGWCLVEILKIDSVLSQPTTQELAYDAITAQWPAGTRILEGDPFVYSVPLARTPESMKRMAGVQSLPPSYQFFLEHPGLNRQPAYDIFGSEYRESLPSDATMNAFLTDNQIQYVIEIDWCQGELTYQNLSDLTFPLITPAIRERLTLVQTFTPFVETDCMQRIENRTHMEFMNLWDWVRPGPIIRLYQVNAQGKEAVSLP